MWICLSRGNVEHMAGGQAEGTKEIGIYIAGAGGLIGGAKRF